MVHCGVDCQRTQRAPGRGRDKEAVHCTSTNHGAAQRNWVLLIRGKVARTDDVQQQNNAENPLGTTIIHGFQYAGWLCRASFNF